MKKKTSDVEFVFPKQVDFESFVENAPLEPFSDEIVAFLNQFSKILFKSSKLKEYPHLVTLSFFCRKANIMLLKKMLKNSLTFTLKEISKMHNVMVHNLMRKEILKN